MVEEKNKIVNVDNYYLIFTESDINDIFVRKCKKGNISKYVRFVYLHEKACEMTMFYHEDTKLNMKRLWKEAHEVVLEESFDYQTMTLTSINNFEHINALEQNILYENIKNYISYNIFYFDLFKFEEDQEADVRNKIQVFTGLFQSKKDDLYAQFDLAAFKYFELTLDNVNKMEITDLTNRLTTLKTKLHTLLRIDNKKPEKNNMLRYLKFRHQNGDFIKLYNRLITMEYNNKSELTEKDYDNYFEKSLLDYPNPLFTCIFNRATRKKYWESIDTENIKDRDLEIIPYELDTTKKYYIVDRDGKALYMPKTLDLKCLKGMTVVRGHSIEDMHDSKFYKWTIRMQGDGWFTINFQDSDLVITDCENTAFINEFDNKYDQLWKYQKDGFYLFNRTYGKTYSNLFNYF